MNREELQVLTDKVIGKKGIMRSSAWWVRKLFYEFLNYLDAQVTDQDTRVRKVEITDSNITLSANVMYLFEGEELVVSLPKEDNNDYVKEYLITIRCVGTPNITMPTEVRWANDAPPVFSDGYTYQISIIDNLAVYAEFIS